MTQTDIVAWYGAVLATLVLFLEIFKWLRAGPIIKVRALTGMETNMRDLKDKKLILVKVTNRGSQKTTITHLVVQHYKTRFHKLINRKNRSFIISNHSIGQPLPYVLEPGEEWAGCIVQDQEFEHLSNNGLLHCGIYHSNSESLYSQRVIVSSSSDI